MILNQQEKNLYQIISIYESMGQTPKHLILKQELITKINVLIKISINGQILSNKVFAIMANNINETLDPAFLKPGKFDRKIEFQLLDTRRQGSIFQTLSSKKIYFDEGDLDDLIARLDKHF
ncbi:unnamed protein product [Paramecium octaurelia]|uniref:Uncharacterized protein n=1 Tax=Paramecium octaurelia TaxID=43137 RepID=A0A8S1YI92_PAROT|nr:unnamed protein product [Paramecium octaurelia]